MTANTVYSGDGFYWKGYNNVKYWFKVSDGGAVRITTTPLVGPGYGPGSYVMWTEAMPDDIFRGFAGLFGKEYFIGWKPNDEHRHKAPNPFDPRDQNRK